MVGINAGSLLKGIASKVIPNITENNQAASNPMNSIFNVLGNVGGDNQLTEKLNPLNMLGGNQDNNQLTNMLNPLNMLGGQDNDQLSNLLNPLKGKLGILG